MKPRETITAFDAFLSERKLGLDAVVVGGTALPDWPAHTRATLDDLRRRLGHGI